MHARCHGSELPERRAVRAPSRTSDRGRAPRASTPRATVRAGRYPPPPRKLGAGGARTGEGEC
jgi:hypothetical protein